MSLRIVLRCFVTSACRCSRTAEEIFKKISTLLNLLYEMTEKPTFKNSTYIYIYICIYIYII